MEAARIASELDDFTQSVAASTAEKHVPKVPGLYSIFIDDPSSFPDPFSKNLVKCESHMVYLGMASKSLYKRLVEQDLQHRNPSTFFRGIGAILGHRPPRGSLLDKTNKNNYRFSRADTETIQTWIKKHLSVCWVETIDVNQRDLRETEKNLIATFRPPINSQHNPDKIAELKHLRAECRRIANS